jgi:hypothetical protein
MRGAGPGAVGSARMPSSCRRICSLPFIAMRLALHASLSCLQEDHGEAEGLTVNVMYSILTSSCKWIDISELPACAVFLVSESPP